MRIKNLIKKHFGDQMWFEVARGGSDDASKYCKKDGQFYEVGTIIPMEAARRSGSKKGGEKTKENGLFMVELAKRGSFHELEVFAPDMYVRYYSTWNKIFMDN